MYNTPKTTNWRARFERIRNLYQSIKDVFLPFLGLVFVASVVWTQAQTILEWVTDKHWILGVILAGFFIVVVVVYLLWRLNRPPAKSRWVRRVEQLYNLVIAVLLAIVAMANLSFLLHAKTLVEYIPSEEVKVSVDSLKGYYWWHLVDTIPIVEVWRAFGVNSPLIGQGTWPGVLVLIFRLVLIYPAIMVTMQLFPDIKGAVRHIGVFLVWLGKKLKLPGVGKPGPITQEMISNLSNDDVIRRRWAVFYLNSTQFRESSVVTQLIEMASGEQPEQDPDVRKEISRALGRLGDESAIDALAHLMEDENALVRQATAGAIGELAKRGVVSKGLTERLEKALSDPKPGVRWRAVEALADMGDIDSISELQKFLAKQPSDSLSADKVSQAIETIDTIHKLRSLVKASESIADKSR